MGLAALGCARRVELRLDAVTFGSAMGVASTETPADGSRWCRAMELSLAAQCASVLPNARSFVGVVEAFCSASVWHRSLVAFLRMQSLAVRANTIVHNAATAALGKCGRWAAALHRLASMSQESTPPDAIAFEVVIPGLSAQPRWAWMLHALAAATARGLKLHVDVHSVIFQECEQNDYGNATMYSTALS